MEQLYQAILISIVAHRGQVRKWEDDGNTPYIVHPLRVMESLDTVEEKIVAMLHDVVEDSSVTLEYLKDRGFSKRVIDAIEALTRPNGVDKIEFATNVTSKNSLATRVKLADLEDNIDLSRIKIKTISKNDKKRVKKYKKIKHILLSV